MPQLVIAMTGAAVPLLSGTVRAGQMIIQNMGVNPVYVGRDTVPVTATTGIELAGGPPGGVIGWAVPTNLSSWQFLGTIGDTVVVIYD